MKTIRAAFLIKYVSALLTVWVSLIIQIIIAPTGGKRILQILSVARTIISFEKDCMGKKFDTLRAPRKRYQSLLALFFIITFHKRF